MKIYRTVTSVKVWLSARDTYNWAHRVGNSWPCSQLSNHRVFAEFTMNGDLVDFEIDGNPGDCDATEFNAIIADLVPTGPVALNI